MKQTATKLAIAGALALALTGAPAADASVFHNNWFYAIDSYTDGYAGGQIGASTNFEFYGMAMKQTGNLLNIAINANLPLGGVAAPGAPSNLISYGDLIFNFSGLNLVDASNASSLMAVRFDGLNDSGVGGNGLYGGVAAKNLSAAHFGFATNAQHAARATALGGTPSMADLSDTDAYFQNNTLNLIDSGAFKSGLAAADLTDLDFANFGANGSETITFAIDINDLPVNPLTSGGWVAHLYAECANDGMAFSTPIPEPGTVLLLGMGFLGAGLARRRRRSE